ncbi:glycosyltransferase family 2 protein [Limimaricola hongkongensis]|uniref:Glycosyl transferase, family 2 n=1 Tax=Limimaricola hongkongensis DSM 17492 TaxID=1122180 RepID=A0A017H7I6_9RHOB|nr:glycosyltransferase family 2 protein [Limimaricola hongkongensis]EYD70346.1 Glycosyl transferase, family 2 [Limimaricola hongkongensis DSM 17492]
MTDAAPATPRATVVIAAWNAEASIDRAIASALRQTLPVEVVVVDDASTDGTRGRIAALARANPALRCIGQDRNPGPAEARNRAIEASRAPWIAVLDADDVMAPDRLERLVRQAEAARLDFLADDIEKVDEADPDGPRQRLYSDHAIGTIDIDAAAFIRANLAAGHGDRREMGFLKPVMRRGFLDRHALRYAPLRLGEDYDLYARALIRGARFRLTDPCGYLATVRANSLSGRHATQDHAALMAADRRMLSQPGLSRETRAALRAHLLEHHRKWVWRRMIDAVRNRDPKAALACLISPPRVSADLSRRLLREGLQRGLRRGGTG